MHFFADLNEPHHASNQTGGPATAHTEFEKWVGTVKYDYAISSSGNTTDSDYYTNTVGNFTYLSDFLTNHSDFYASAAKGLAGSAQMSSSWDDWEYVAEESLENAQKSVALVYYRFLHEVAGDDILGNPDPIGKFHVLFKVANEYEAGTDDYVYFGMEFSDGRKLEFECDVPGNDFYRDLRWGYEFNITDSSYEASDITRVWIRKKDYTLWGDDLKLDYIEVYM
ncbi:MAG: phospholipase, partial [Desulfobacterales bacterium]|nr:phospholipase [Desulfobacterales bacterium]